MLRKRIFPYLVVLTAALSVACAPSASAQSIQTGIALTFSTTTAIQGEPVTATATLTVSSGPVSALNGLSVEFDSLAGGKQLSTINNGVATATIHPGCRTGCNNTVFATFYLTGNFGPSSTMADIQAVAPGALNGQYALLFRGKGDFGGAPSAFAAVGSIGVSFGGGPGLVTGIEDVNTGLGVHQRIAVTGSYTADPKNDGVGEMVLQSSLGTQHLQVFNAYTSLPTSQYPSAPSATIVETDGGPLAGSGEMTLQADTPSAGEGGFVLDLSGETACTNCSSFGHNAGSVFVAGQLFFEYAPQAGGGALSTETIGGQVLPTTMTPATFVPSDTTGRTLFTLTPSSAPGDQPTHFVGYASDASHFYLMSLDSHDKAILLSGSARQQ